MRLSTSLYKHLTNLKLIFEHYPKKVQQTIIPCTLSIPVNLTQTQAQSQNNTCKTNTEATQEKSTMKINENNVDDKAKIVKYLAM